MTEMSAVKQEKGSFVERRMVGVLDRPLVVYGSLLYRRPDFLERRTLPPADELMTVQGDQLSIDWPSKNTSRRLSLSSNPIVWSFVEAIRATLAGDQGKLERFYWVSLRGTSQAWMLTLEPRAAGISAYVSLIRLTGARSAVTRVEVVQANGDRSIMDITPAP